MWEGNKLKKKKQLSLNPTHNNLTLLYIALVGTRNSSTTLVGPSPAPFS